MLSESAVFTGVEVSVALGDIKVTFSSAQVGEFVIARRMGEELIRTVCGTSPSNRRRIVARIADDYIGDAVRTYQARIDSAMSKRENRDGSDRDLGRAS
jgi:hypothetical protein